MKHPVKYMLFATPVAVCIALIIYHFKAILNSAALWQAGLIIGACAIIWLTIELLNLARTINPHMRVLPPPFDK